MIALVLAVVFGVGSAVLPFLNAEAYALAIAAHSEVWLIALVALALAVGQTIGKLVLFEVARRGAGHAVRRERVALQRWTSRLGTRLACRRTGLPLVLVSAGLGLPPLAVVSLAAGASGQRRWEFAMVCLIGRSIRFALLVVPVALVLA